MKTDFVRRPKKELEADREKMLNMVLRPGFDHKLYWYNLRKDLPVYEGKNKQ